MTSHFVYSHKLPIVQLNGIGVTVYIVGQFTSIQTTLGVIEWTGAQFVCERNSSANHDICIRVLSCAQGLFNQAPEKVQEEAYAATVTYPEGTFDDHRVILQSWSITKRTKISVKPEEWEEKIEHPSNTWITKYSELPSHDHQLYSYCKKCYGAITSQSATPIYGCRS
jgi:hypothetical protein